MGPCPRCNTELTQQTGRPPGRDADVTVDVCARCQGMWIDGAELSLTSDALASLPKRLPGIIATARDSRGGPVCPRCSSTLVELAVVGVPVDLCTGCCGAWLDGGEYQRIIADKPRPAAQPKIDQIVCKGCRAPTPLAESFYTDQGLVCGACNEKVTAEEMRARAVASGAVAAYEGFAARYAEARRPEPQTITEMHKLQREVELLRREIRGGRY